MRKNGNKIAAVLKVIRIMHHELRHVIVQSSEMRSKKKKKMTSIQTMKMMVLKRLMEEG